MGPERSLKQAVFELFRAPKHGDLLMDAPKVTSWRVEGLMHLCICTCAREQWWRERVRALRQPRVQVCTYGISQAVRSEDDFLFFGGAQGHRDAVFILTAGAAQSQHRSVVCSQCAQRANALTVSQCNPALTHTHTHTHTRLICAVTVLHQLSR